jgi:hypothetical protein
LDKGITIESVRLLEKTGGKSSFILPLSQSKGQDDMARVDKGEE